MVQKNEFRCTPIKDLLELTFDSQPTSIVLDLHNQFFVIWTDLLGKLFEKWNLDGPIPWQVLYRTGELQVRNSMFYEPTVKYKMTDDHG